MPRSGSRIALRRSWWRWLTPAGVGATLLVAGAVAAINVSPRLGVLVIRTVFGINDRSMIAALRKHKPAAVTSIVDIPYRPDDPTAQIDVFVPNAAIERGEPRPTVVWTHGGAWVTGSKDDWHTYFMVLASRGYTVVAIGYALGPNHVYPTALHQVNDAMRFVLDNADELHIDPARIVMAGDSAGAQLTSQYAAMVTNPAYAAEVGLEPSLPPDRLGGVILYCGIYDFETFFEPSGLIGWGFRTAMWAYTGNRGTTFERNPALGEMSSIHHVTADFPPAFISGGNADGLTVKQSQPMAERLRGLGVDVTTLFFSDDHEPGQAHEFQFNLDTDEGQQALDESVRFLESVFLQP